MCGTDELGRDGPGDEAMGTDDGNRRDGRGHGSNGERERGEGERRRRRHRHRGGRRKERVLHTRISDDLAEDIRRIADDLRVPVSNIVRNVLEEAFSVVESMTDDVGDLVEEVVDEADAARQRIAERRRRQRARRRQEDAERSTGAEDAVEVEAADDDVVGWQPLVLHRARLCRLCGASLERGESAYVALTQHGVGSDFACESCVRR